MNECIFKIKKLTDSSSGRGVASSDAAAPFLAGVTSIQEEPASSGVQGSGFDGVRSDVE